LGWAMAGAAAATNSTGARAAATEAEKDTTHRASPSGVCEGLFAGTIRAPSACPSKKFASVQGWRVKPAYPWVRRQGPCIMRCRRHAEPPQRPAARPAAGGH
jgi:hypothetical protein